MKSAVETSMNCLTKAMTAVEGTPLENFYWPIFKHLSKYKICQCLTITLRLMW
jgi:hypothetical protein